MGLVVTLDACGADSAVNSASAPPAPRCLDGVTESCTCPGGEPGLRDCSNGTLDACSCPSTLPDAGSTIPPVESDAGMPQQPGPACFTPCGGFIGGHWKFASTCTTDISFACAAHLEAIPAGISGDLTFGIGLDGSFAGAVGTTAVLTSCPMLQGRPQSASDCASFESTLSNTPGLEAVSCSWKSPECTCSYTARWNSIYSGTDWQIAGTAVRIGTPSAYAEYDYCVSGNNLTLRPVTDRSLATDAAYVFHKVICDPNAPLCDGNVAKTCDASGTGYAAETPCKADVEACSEGACKPIVCKPNEVKCNGTDIETCNALGTESAKQPCPANNYCDGTTATPVCKPVVCTPSAGACDGTVSTTCNDVGSGYVGNREDCASAARACSPGAGCLVPQGYDVGSTYQPFHAGPYEKEEGNLFTITQDVRLIEVQSYLSLSSNEQVTFVIYESAVMDAMYPKILTKTVSANAGTGMVSTGPINVSLKAGFYYVITARPDGDFGTSWGYGGLLPFGNAVGSISRVAPSETMWIIGSTASTTSYYYQRLIVGAP